MTHPTLLLALTLGSLGLTGCGGWLSREAVPTTTPPIITVQDIRPIGTPLVTIQPTSVGWQVTARQPIERTEVEERAVTERVQRHLFFPPALFTGLIQCPIGSLTWLLTIGTYGRDLATHGCWRLLMIETLPGDATMTSQVTNTTRTVTDSEPLRGAIVQLKHTPHLTNWTGILASDGTILIPYRALAEQPLGSPTAHLTIQRQHNTIWRGPLPNVPTTVQTPPSPRAWPNMLVFQIEDSHVGDPTVLHPFRQLLQHELLRQGHCVVVGDSTRTRLRDEVMMQQAGLISDAGPTVSLNWIPATVLIRTAQDSRAGSDGVQVSWIDVEHGQVIDEERLFTYVNVGHLSTQMRMMIQEKLPSQRGCEKGHSPLKTSKNRNSQQ